MYCGTPKAFHDKSRTHLRFCWITQAPLRRSLFCFARHIKMHFRIHFCICVYQHIQPCFFTLRFLPENRIFSFGTGFAHSRMSGKSLGNKPLTKENHHDPNTPHPRRNRRRHHHRQKHPRHITKEAIYGNRLPRLHNRIPRILLQQPLLTKETTMPNVLAFLALVGAFIITLKKS